MADERSTVGIKSAIGDTYTQAEVDALVGVVGRQGRRAERLVATLIQVARDRSITAAGRELVRSAIEDARAIAEGRHVLPGGPIPGSLQEDGDGS